MATVDLHSVVDLDCSVGESGRKRMQDSGAGELPGFGPSMRTVLDAGELQNPYFRA